MPFSCKNSPKTIDFAKGGGATVSGLFRAARVLYDEAMQRRSLQAPLSGDCAVFLDIDGTLLDIAVTPDAVTVPPFLPVLLHRLAAARDGALALVSGRSMADIDRMFGTGLAVAAEHGALLRGADGEMLRAPAGHAALTALAAPLRQLVARHPGALLEEKQCGFAIHWRRAPDSRDALVAAATRLAGGEDALVLLPAHSAMEIRLRGADKATALAHFMQAAPFAGRPPVFVGDDTTDEPAIAWAAAHGGRGLHVGRDFAGSVEAVRDWLAADRETAGAAPRSAFD